MLKRILDIAVAVPTLVVLAPVLLVIAIAIRVTSRGAAIFRQERAGLGGQPFVLYKFRTLRTDTDPFGPSPKSGHDPRITRLGRFLRETSLDELPQLVNVLKGDMSLVGPRPLYVSQIAEWDDRQKRRLLVKPGLTGLAQVRGRGALTREQKLDLDVAYVDCAGLWMDLKILAATAVGVVRRTSVYEDRYSQAEATRGQDRRL